MDCVNHSGIGATAYCQSCGKALCAVCVRKASAGQILCEPCLTAWQGFQQPFTAPGPRGPNPVVAGALGLIPGVGAMYNGQILKGFMHVIVFAVLVSITSVVHGNLDVFFGLMIPAWILYQVFDAYHTAKAFRDGQPLPDPFGLNQLGDWMNLGGKPQYPGQAGAAPAGQAPAAGGSPQPPYQGQYQPPYWQDQGPIPFTPPVPPVPPASPAPPQVPFAPQYWHPVFWGRKEPIGAVVLIGLGALFLLGQLDVFHGRLWEFAWPLALIGLGAWLIGIPTIFQVNHYILIRRLRRPAILILIGVVALLENLGIFNCFWCWFLPLLLILLGALMLAERAVLAAEGGYPPVAYPGSNPAGQPYAGAPTAGAGAPGASASEPSPVAESPAQPQYFEKDSEGGQS